MIRLSSRTYEQRFRLLQVGLLLAVALPLALAYLLSADFRAEIGRAVRTLGERDVDTLRTYLLSFGNWAPLASLLLMVLQALLAPVPAFLVVFANGLAFGVFWGGVLSLAGQALAAVVCFWIARTMGRAPIEALLGKLGLESADGWFARRGPRGILLARLIPGIAFDGISYAAGLTRIGFWRFAGATVVGVAPQTFAYSYMGENATEYIWALLAVTIAVVVGVGTATLFRRRRPRPAI